MADKPILFSASMVRALLEGRKTQTRRLIKDRGVFPQFCGGRYDDKNDPAAWGWEDHDRGEWVTLDQFRTFRFVPISLADRLYVREAHYLTDDGTSEYAIFAEESADVTAHREEIEDLQIRHPQSDWSKHLRLRPSIHMPRWASRLTLTVTDVRVQRLQDISEADAVAEGIERLHGGYHDDDDVYLNYLRKSDGFGGSGAGRASFRTLWNSLHGPEAWDANPWVVAYSFDVHRGNIDQMEGQS